MLLFRILEGFHEFEYSLLRFTLLPGYSLSLFLALPDKIYFGLTSLWALDDRITFHTKETTLEARTWNCWGTKRKLRNWNGIHNCQLARTDENHSCSSFGTTCDGLPSNMTNADKNIPINTGAKTNWSSSRRRKAPEAPGRGINLLRYKYQKCRAGPTKASPTKLNKKVRL